MVFSVKIIFFISLLAFSLVPTFAYATNDNDTSTSTKINNSNVSRGDILISSSTILAFFGFGSFFLFRFQNKYYLDHLTALLGIILLCVFAIECSQIYIIISVVTDNFDAHWYIGIMIAVAILFGIILGLTFIIIYIDSNSVDVAEESEEDLETKTKAYSKSPVNNL